MVQAIITLGEQEDKIVNVVKAQHGFKNKSEAINFVVATFHKEILDDACPICDGDKLLKPAFVKKIQAIEKEKGIPFKHIEELRKIIEG